MEAIDEFLKMIYDQINHGKVTTPEGFKNMVYDQHSILKQQLLKKEADNQAEIELFFKNAIYRGPISYDKSLSISDRLKLMSELNILISHKVYDDLGKECDNLVSIEERFNISQAIIAIANSIFSETRMDPGNQVGKFTLGNDPKEAIDLFKKEFLK